MNLFILAFNLLFIIKNIFAQVLQNNINNNDNNNNIKSKRDSANGECQYINKLLGKSDLYDCCNYSGITCLNNHITK
eukprot:jgi/Orpsp1_1/1184992/evm.model.c7180000091878.1